MLLSLGGHGLLTLFICLFSRKPIDIALVTCKSRALNSLALVTHFLNFKISLLKSYYF